MVGEIRDYETRRCGEGVITATSSVHVNTNDAEHGYRLINMGSSVPRFVLPEPHRRAADRPPVCEK
jgi:hypothetical protein